MRLHEDQRNLETKSQVEMNSCKTLCWSQFLQGITGTLKSNGTSPTKRALHKVLTEDYAQEIDSIDTWVTKFLLVSERIPELTN
jgi:hypothetical protein